MGTKELSNGVWNLSQGFHTGVIKHVLKNPLTLGHPTYIKSVHELMDKTKHPIQCICTTLIP